MHEPFVGNPHGNFTVDEHIVLEHEYLLLSCWACYEY